MVAFVQCLSPALQEKGFLIFPPEIRLQVYRHLFIARERIPWCGVREPPKPIEFKTLEWYVDGIQRGGDSVVCRDSLPGDLCCWYEYSLGLALPLLQTCKKIHEEATTVLYGENIFHFGIKCRDPSIPAAIPAQKGRIISQCLRLFEFSDEAWTWDLCDAIQHSVLARFLYKIGRRNAASLKTLGFLIEEPDGREGPPETRPMTEIIMRLIQYHMSSISGLTIVLEAVDEDEGIAYEGNEDEVAVREIIEETIQDFPKLKYLCFAGFDRYPFVARDLEKLRKQVAEHIPNDAERVVARLRTLTHT